MTSVALIVLVITLMPIDTARSGECSVGSSRVSLLFEGREKFDKVKTDYEKNKAEKAEYLRKNPGMSMGCSAGPTYHLYLL